MKLTNPMSLYATGTRASVAPAASALSTVAVVEMRRERALVHAGIAPQGWGELCPLTSSTIAARDAKFFRPFPGTADSGGPPV